MGGGAANHGDGEGEKQATMHGLETGWQSLQLDQTEGVRQANISSSPAGDFFGEWLNGREVGR